MSILFPLSAFAGTDAIQDINKKPVPVYFHDVVEESSSVGPDEDQAVIRINDYQD